MRDFVSLGMFIIDEFSFADEHGQPTGKSVEPQIGGGGTYAAIGARIWLPPNRVGMIIDRGHDFPPSIQSKLDQYAKEMWLFRDDPKRGTTRAMNAYKGELRGFEYLTPRIRLTPRDLTNTPLTLPKILHFICSPTRAAEIISEIHDVKPWSPLSIYEPIPDRCVPEELPALKKVIGDISVLSPNAEEALSLLSMPLPPTKESIEQAAAKFVEFGVGAEGKGWVVVRSGALGAYIVTRDQPGVWMPAFWQDASEKVVDVTGAGNAFLGGFAAGLAMHGDPLAAALFAAISASFVIEQLGLPRVSRGQDREGDEVDLWNDDVPWQRLEALQDRIDEEQQSSKAKASENE